ncbi:hypothetical protein DXJ84_11240 [Vibrio parahaemolyticus]|uniref:hypothetical protein n=1 Tax=Vibrio parahaemolyticus TaxID=670 RepID=UPI0011226A83|nr:hypothetical protein [Vibrio parahaemolyticus]TPA27684.1 hypothetical protein DXJ84_11240 [Vibrio parahaemolyticus]
MKMMKFVLYIFMIAFTVANSEYLYAYTGDCENISGNQRNDINLGVISLTQATNIANYIIYDQELTSETLVGLCDCDDSFVQNTHFSGYLDHSTLVDNYAGLSWYTIPGNNSFAFSLEVDVYDGYSDRFERLTVPFSDFNNNTSEKICKGPSTLSSLTRGRLRIRLLKPIIGIEDLNATLGYFKMRRNQAPVSSSPVFRMINVKGTISSAHQCSVTGSFTSKYTFATTFLNDFDDYIPSINTQMPPIKHVSHIYCNYSNVPVEIEFLGDFSAYGLKTDLDGVEIYSVLSILTFGSNDVIRNVSNKFLTSLDSNGYKRIQFTSVPILTLPKSQVTLGEYSATMHIRVNFK